MQITSSAFVAMGEIPRRHTCDGADESPPLEWSGVPTRARSLALIVDDPDAPDPAAPQRTWVHWVLVDLPPQDGSLPSGVRDLPAGARVGLNDWRRSSWGGPCPPIGRHRYFFRLYALDRPLSELRHPTKAEVEQAMQGHVLARAELVGLYARTR